ncbi:MAG TPA: aconitate hydratase [Pyrinomonadaceae bacterium]|jgi:aconitate hydratase A / 2-methylisocitrate dehydratase|nr:aconitate hydratase [Pyrinomonadaceae bacterium]
MPHNLWNTLQSFEPNAGKSGQFYSLPQLEKEGIGPVSKLPVSIRIVLESVLRNFDGTKITEDDVRAVANWQAGAERTEEVPFVVARVLLQDFTGVPLLVDLAAMRSAVTRLNKNPAIIEPLVPVDLVIDHSVQVDFSSTPDAFRKNMEMEFKRNNSRYQFLKWGMQAFDGFRVIPPGIGICHQVNLEYLAKCVWEKYGVYYPDSLVGTDSHTTMVNGLSVVGWGVGGIEAEAAMLGQPVYFLTPDVVGVHMSGQLREGVTATDLVLAVTELLRKAKVVGKFVEFHGEGAASLSVVDRATIANMSPEYGATMGYFPPDDKTCEYLKATGRDDDHVEAVGNYFKAQGMFGMPRKGEIEYSTLLELDLDTIVPSVAGPKRPQDRIPLPELKNTFINLLQQDSKSGGYGKPYSEIDVRYAADIGASEHALAVVVGGGQQHSVSAPAPSGNDVTPRETSVWTETEMMNNRPTPDRVAEVMTEEFPKAHVDLGHGDVLIAAITSCTNTSNPSVMLAAGLLAKKAVERGLKVRPTVKTSLAPGSRVVTEYLEKTGLQPYLNQLGFNLVGYGCTTCIGNSGPLDPTIEEMVNDHDLIAASVLSGNRNFEARVHQSIKANFLMSPPLVVAFALAGSVEKDLSKEALGQGSKGEDVYLRDIWPTMEEISGLMSEAMDPETYRRLYGNFADQNPMWNSIPASSGLTYKWDANSTYIQDPPFFVGFGAEVGEMEDIHGARPLAIFGDSVTTDHISPAGAIKATSPAGVYLQQRRVDVADFNSYGSRRGNHEVMMRGTFANVRIKNLMVPGTEGGVTVHQPDGERMSIYDASMKYQSEGTPLVVIAGQEYGTGSSRDWAAKGTRLLGIKAVVAESFERIHRSNLVGMGVLPCQFKEGTNAASLNLDGTETFDITGLESGDVSPRQDVMLTIHRADGSTDQVPLTLRIDTPIEIDYYLHGGILPYVLRQLLAGTTGF